MKVGKGKEFWGEDREGGREREEHGRPPPGAPGQLPTVLEQEGGEDESKTIAVFTKAR